MGRKRYDRRNVMQYLNHARNADKRSVMQTRPFQKKSYKAGALAAATHASTIVSVKFILLVETQIEYL